MKVELLCGYTPGRLNAGDTIEVTKEDGEEMIARGRAKAVNPMAKTTKPRDDEVAKSKKKAKSKVKKNNK